MYVNPEVISSLSGEAALWKYDEEGEKLENSVMAIDGHLIKFPKSGIIENHKHIEVVGKNI